jgi:hypothetical protein
VVLSPQLKRAATILQQGVREQVNAAIVKQLDQAHEPVTMWRPWWQLDNPRYWKGELGRITKISPCTCEFPATEWPLDYIAAPVFAEKLGYGDAWWVTIAGTRHEEVYDDVVQAPEGHGVLYRCGVKQLRFPKEISGDLTVADVCKLVWWRKINRHRAQMQYEYPPIIGPLRNRKPFHTLPLDTPRLARRAKWRCCRLKSCPLKCVQRRM